MKVVFVALNTFDLALILLANKTVFSYSSVTANITIN